MKNAELVQRIETLERELAEVKRHIHGNDADAAKPKSDWRDFVGIFANDPYFERAVKAGAAYRRSLRPRARKGKGRGK
jgi:hypothetical protein